MIHLLDPLSGDKNIACTPSLFGDKMRYTAVCKKTHSHQSDLEHNVIQIILGDKDPSLGHSICMGDLSVAVVQPNMT